MKYFYNLGAWVGTVSRCLKTGDYSDSEIGDKVLTDEQ